MTKAEIAYTGNSYLSYNFSLYGLTSSLSRKEGVFAILRKTSSGFEPLYFGITTNCKLQMEERFFAQLFTNHDATHVGFLEEPSLGVRIFIRNDLIKSLQPRFNK